MVSSSSNVSSFNGLDDKVYYYGDGVDQDYVYAFMWWEITASNGYDKAKANKNKVEGMMNSSDVSEAQRLARECVKKNYKGC